MRIQSLIIVALFISSFASNGWSQKQQKPADAYQKNPVLALVDGKPLRLEDLQNKASHDLSQKLHQTLELLLMQEALKQLAKTHKDINPNPKFEVSDAQVKKFYDSNKLSSRGTLDKLKGAISGHLRQQQMRQYVKTQYDRAVKKGWITSYLEAPTDFLVEASAKGSYIRGNAQAKVMFLEFSDYQCPFCGRIQKTIDQLMAKYDKQVAFGYKHFPLSFHKEADEAAIAVECAREQGQFEAMHSILYKNQRAQKISDLKRYAKQVKIKNMDQFNKCLDTEKYRHVVDANLKEGAALGMSGTPAFVIGRYDPKTQEIRGETVSGALPLDRFEVLIKKYLN